MDTINNNINNRFAKLKCCILVPTYNNAATVGNVVKELLSYTDQVIVVNDGCTDGTAEILSAIPQLDILEFSENRGKGIALREGFKYAHAKGFKYAITIDSDGQHLPEDLPKFLDKIEVEPNSLIVGARNMDQEGIPGRSSFGHKFSNFWYKVETGINLPDTQSGYRLYPLDEIMGVKYITSRFEFEIEVIVRAAWKGINVTSVPISVVYQQGEDRVTHFRPGADSVRMSVLNTALVTIAFLYARPRLFFQKIGKMSFKEFFNKHILDSEESNAVKAFSAAFGIFMGIIPIWGYQMATAIVLAVFFRLNKALVLLTAQISVPPLIPFILYFSYKTGGLVLGKYMDNDDFIAINDWLQNHLIPLWVEQKFPDMVGNLFQYLVGSVIFASVAATLTGLLTYGLLVTLRKRK